MNRRSKPETEQRNRRLRPIDPHLMYPLSVLAEHAGLTVENGLRMAQKSGLRTHQAAGRKYVLGADFIKWVCRER